MDIYFLWSNQDVQKVLSTCLANTKYSYTGHSIKPDVSAPPPSPLPMSQFSQVCEIIFYYFLSGKFYGKKWITQPFGESRNELPNPFLFGANPRHKFWAVPKVSYIDKKSSRSKISLLPHGLWRANQHWSPNMLQWLCLRLKKKSHCWYPYPSFVYIKNKNTTLKGLR